MLKLKEICAVDRMIFAVLFCELFSGVAPRDRQHEVEHGVERWAVGRL